MFLVYGLLFIVCCTLKLIFDIVIGILIRSYFQLSVSSPHKKGKVSNGLKRASAGRFFRPRNFCLFYSGLYSSIWASTFVFKRKSVQNNI